MLMCKRTQRTRQDPFEEVQLAFVNAMQSAGTLHPHRPHSVGSKKASILMPILQITTCAMIFYKWMFSSNSPFISFSFKLSSPRFTF